MTIVYGQNTHIFLQYLLVIILLLFTASCRCCIIYLCINILRSVAYFQFGKGRHGEDGAWAYNGVSQRGPGAEAAGSRNTCSFWMLNENGKFVHFSEIWKRRKSQIFCRLANVGGHRTMSPKYAIVYALNKLFNFISKIR